MVKRRLLFSSLLGLALASGIGARCWAEQMPPAHDAAARQCKDLKTRDLTRLTAAPTVIISAETEAIGARKVCEVQGYVHPQSRFTLRVPVADWNGDLLFQGCGGLCGRVYIDRANDALSRGYATVATDMGHVSTPLDGLWAYDNDEALIDFAHRSTHRVAVAAKEILNTYTKPPTRSYFRGCSTGGRQGLIAAQRYPDDFDGIIAGAPVLNYIHGSSLQLLWSVLVARGEGGYAPLTSSDVAILADHVVAACDARDGRQDGVIDAPRACDVDLSAVCDDAGRCLSPAAARTAQAVYAGPAAVLPGPTIRGPEFGSEPNWIGTYVGTDARPPLYAKMVPDIFRYMAFEQDPGPSWQPTFSELADYYEQSRQHHELISATDPNLEPFFSRGGKLVVYHGWRDQSITPDSTLQYVADVAQTSPSAQKSLRTFLVPGLNHCSGGIGAVNADWLGLLEDWAETGRPPDVVELKASSTQQGSEVHTTLSATAPLSLHQ